MVTTSGERIEETAIIIPDGVQKTITSIKEIVGSHYSDADVYVTLKESSMDPNESVQKLLHQDTFHEVKRRKNKKKEMESVQSQKKSENKDEHTRPRTYPYRTHQIVPYPRNAVAGNASGRSTSNPDAGNAAYSGKTTSNPDAGNAAFSERKTSNPDAGNAAYLGKTTSNPDAGTAAYPGRTTLNPDAGKAAYSEGKTSNHVAGNAAYSRRGTSKPAAAGRGKVFPAARNRVLPAAGRIKEFRVVRDNRANQNINKEMKPNSQQGSTHRSEPTTSNPAEMSSTGTSNKQNSLGGKTISYSQAPNGSTNLHVRPASDTNSRGDIVKELAAGQTIVSNTAVRGITGKSVVSQTQTTRPSSSNSVAGVYSSSLDPVHVPSLGSRSSTAVGAIRREVGVVGVRKQSSQAVKHPSTPVSALPNPISEKDNSSSSEVPELSSHIPKNNKLNQIASHDSSTQTMSLSKPLLTNHYGSRSSHQAMSHKKAFKPIKEWKAKSNKKSDGIAPGIIGSPAKSALPSADIPADHSIEPKNEAVKMQDNLSRLNIHDNQNVVIAEHLRVAETDRCLLTFGSIVPGFEPVGSTEASTRESSPSVPEPVQTSSHSDISASREVHKQEDAVTNSHLHPAAAAELPVHSSSPHNLDSYADIGIVHENKHFYASLEPQHVQEVTEMPSFAAYDPPTGYDMPYYRPTVDVSSRGHGLPSPQEDLTSYMTNNMPPSTIAMMPQQQQQQPPLGQMYPQVHLSQYPNMPYRQFVSPVYVPQMAMPGYSSPAYPHQSNGGNYMVMPGGNSHPNMSSLKYGIQQFKPLPNAAPTGFGNYTTPSGYAMNASGVVGGAIGIEDSSRLKYKDGNLYVPNPQAETSEMWMQNPRDLQGMQSAQYYNMTGQQTPHRAYLPSHSGHTQFSPPGMYHPQQQPGLASPYHLAPGMGSNLAGIGMPAPVSRAQVGGYQQQQQPQAQLNHLNWIPDL